MICQNFKRRIEMKMNQGSSFPSAPIGMHQATCFGVVDIGTQETNFKGEKGTAKQCILFFEYAKLKLDDGRPMIQNRYYTMSMGELASLYKHIKSWFGKTMTQKEKDDFDSKELIGQGCVLQIIMNSNDKPKIENILPLMDGMEAYVAENKVMDYELTKDYIPDDLYDWVKDKIRMSLEWKGEKPFPPKEGEAPLEESGTEPF
jgi:hypothetical protein